MITAVPSSESQVLSIQFTDQDRFVDPKIMGPVAKLLIF